MSRGNSTLSYKTIVIGELHLTIKNKNTAR